MVLERQIGIEQGPNPLNWRWDVAVHAQTAVAKYFRIGDVLEADPPVVEVHGQTDAPECSKSQNRHNDDFDDFLLVVGKARVHSGRVLGQVMGAMVLPQARQLVARAVVAVEEEVKGDAVKAQLGEHKPPPLGVAHGVERRYRSVVRDHDGHGETEAGRLVHLANNLACACVGDAVAGVGAVQVPVPVYETTQHADLTHGDEHVGCLIEEEGCYLANVVAGV